MIPNANVAGAGKVQHFDGGSDAPGCRPQCGRKGLRAMLGWALACGLCLATPGKWAGAADPDIRFGLMHWTFRLSGPSLQGGKRTVGTVFILGDGDGMPAGSARYVMVTAAHVVEGIAGERAELLLRKKGAGAAFEAMPTSLALRDARTNLWVRHPVADVAAMFVSLPVAVGHPCPLVPTGVVSVRPNDGEI
jgi:hypothetical protein